MTTVCAENRAKNFVLVCTRCKKDFVDFGLFHLHVQNHPCTLGQWSERRKMNPESEPVFPVAWSSEQINHVKEIEKHQERMLETTLRMVFE